MNTVLTRFMRIFVLLGVIFSGTMLPESTGQDGWRRFLVPTLAAGVASVVTAVPLILRFRERNALIDMMDTYDAAIESVKNENASLQIGNPGLKNQLCHGLALHRKMRKAKDALRAESKRLEVVKKDIHTLEQEFFQTMLLPSACSFTETEFKEWLKKNNKSFQSYELLLADRYNTNRDVVWKTPDCGKTRTEIAEKDSTQRIAQRVRCMNTTKKIIKRHNKYCKNETLIEQLSCQQSALHGQLANQQGTSFYQTPLRIAATSTVAATAFFGLAWAAQKWAKTDLVK